MAAAAREGAPERRAAAGSARSRAYEQARRHTRRVRFFKFTIPLGAALAIGLVLLVTIYDPFGRMGGVSLGPLSLSGTKITMDSPRLTGHRKDNRPYEVTATVAVQDVRKPNVLELKDMRARFVVDDSGRATRLVADTGIFDTVKEKLELRQNVRVATDDGYEARLTSASIDFKAGTVVSRERITVKLPNGQVEADALDMIDSGKVISFVGRVSSVFEPPPEKPAPTPAATAELPLAPAVPVPARAKTSLAEPTSLRP